MKRGLSGLFVATVVSAWLLLAFANDNPAGNRAELQNGYYSGDYWYDPYYRSPCCSGATLVVPPSVSRPLSGQPGGRPPAQLPSRPGPSPLPMPGSGAQ